jgi:hypothetical protein
MDQQFEASIEDLNTLPKHEEFKLGPWLIRAQNFPDQEGKYDACAHNEKAGLFFKLSTKSKKKASKEQAIAAIKNVIAFQTEAAKKPKVGDYKKITFDLNCEFSNQEVPQHCFKYIRIVKADDGIFLDASETHHEGDQELYERLRYDDTVFYAFPYGKQKFKATGLEEHGRYYLVYETDVGDYKRYRFVFDSFTEASNENVRLFKPGVTIAVC